MDGLRVGLHGVVHAHTLSDKPRLGKRRTVAWAASALLVLSCPTRAAAPPAGAAGPWVLDCPAETCRLRHRQPLFAKAGITADLEVRASFAGPVPVIAVRGLPREPLLSVAVANRIAATLQLDGQRPVPLSCGLSADAYVCQPSGSGAAALVRALPDARSVTIGLSVTLAGEEPDSLGRRTLDLADTRAALALLPAHPVMEREPQAIPPGWTRLLDRGLKAAGFPNGAADLSALLARLLRR
jgi:hypothetical protein